jgi:rare lipoprotein A
MGILHKMLTLRRYKQLAALLALGLLAAGCTTASRAPSLVAKVEPPPRGKGGTYKVGNPYQIDGVWYYPAEDLGYEETGIASWYGEQFHAKYTANGEIFDLNSLTAAHRTLPMPCVVQVTNLENGRTIQLRVNDRGPFARGRILDVSRRGAQLLGFEGQGTAKVRVKILVPESIQVAAIAGRNGGADATAMADAPVAAPRTQVVAEALPVAPGVRAKPARAVAALPSAAPSPDSRVAQMDQPIEPPPLPEKVTVVPVKPTNIFIQVGAFSRSDNAARARSRAESFGPVRMASVRQQGIELYRVRLGPIESVDEADKLLSRVVESGLTEAKIVVD